MKKKISRIWGVGLVVVLVTSLLLSAAPVSAGTHSWSKDKTVPDGTGKVIEPGSDVVDLAVAGDGETIYAVSPGNETLTWEVITAPTAATANASITTLTYTDQDGNAGSATVAAIISATAAVGDSGTITIGTDTGVRDVSALVIAGWTGDTVGEVAVKGATSGVSFGTDNTTSAAFVDGNIPKGIYRSTNAGATWTVLDNPDDVNTSIDFVAVAPDEPDVIAVVCDGAAAEVHVSDDGGSGFDALGTPQEGTTGGVPAAVLDLAVSPSSTHYIAVAGYESGGIANVWKYNFGASVPAWTETNDKDGFHTPAATGFGSPEVCTAVDFSPNFASDKVMVAISEDDGADVMYEMFSLSTSLWNEAAGFTGYPVSLVTSTTITDLPSASIALSPDFLGSDEAMRIAFVGLNVAGTTTDDAGYEASGIYRVQDDEEKGIKTGSAIKINSVAYDGVNLVAGRFDDTTTYRTDNPLATDPTFRPTSSLKRPGGDDKVLVAWAGADVVAGTTGNESAFAVSRNNGESFNDISLIDSALTTMNDFALSPDGSQVYLATDDGSDFSLWRKASAWERVFSVQDKTGFIVRIAPEDADVVYLVDVGTKTIYFSSDAGETKWFTRAARDNVADLAVESADVAYAAKSSAKTLRKSTNGGFIWGGSDETKLEGGNIASITSLGEDNLLVGSTTGYVSYSTDGGDTWTAVVKQLDASGATQVTATGLADGDYIYAATAAADTLVERRAVGDTTGGWDDTEALITTGHGVYGLAFQDGTLFVLSANVTGTGIESLRSQDPDADAPAWSEMVKAEKVFRATPSALKLTTGDGYVGLWAIESAPAPDELFYYNDYMLEAGPELVGPADGTEVPMNPVSGTSFDVSFSWNRLSKAQTYELVIALDTAFKEKAITVDGADLDSDSSIVGQIVGPNGPSDGQLAYMPDTTYYWKVRVRATEKDINVRSPWSEVRSFTVGHLEVAPPVTITPAPPAPVVSVPPPIVNLPAPIINLPPQVAPPPAIVIPPAPPAPAPITPAFIWAVIIIGAVLVIAVIVLIVRTRRVV